MRVRDLDFSDQGYVTQLLSDGANDIIHEVAASLRGNADMCAREAFMREEAKLTWDAPRDDIAQLLLSVLKIEADDELLAELEAEHERLFVLAATWPEHL